MIGITHVGDLAARWLEAGNSHVGCVEIAADGFFARPTPYLSWLGAQFPVLIRATSLSVASEGPLNQARLDALVSLCDVANARSVVHPLGFCTSDDIRLPALAPISLTQRSLDRVAARVLAAAAACGRPTLIEPISSLLRVPGTLGEPDFLTRLCRETGSRLLIDATTLLAASRNHGVDPDAWLRGIPPGLIGAARISGSALRLGKWHSDSQGDIDEDAWTLLDQVVARGRPDLLLLHHDPAEGMGVVVKELARLQEAGASTSGAAVPTEPPQSPPVQPAPDVALFVLDRQGVFFSGSRRELRLFNTSATLVWCLIDEGRTVSQITDAYRQAFDLGEADASRHVGTILQQWFGLGYIGYPGPLDAASVPFTAALAQLLTNPQLRTEFRRSCYEVARRLRVAEEDTGSFVGLNPDELDAQADELTRAATLLEPTFPPSDADSGRPDRRTPTARARHYRLLSTTFAVDAGSEALSDRVREALVHLECQDPSPHVVLELRPSESGGWVVFNQGEAVAECRQDDGVVPSVKQLLRQIAVDRHPFLVSVHAGVVSFGHGCVLLPAAAGSGKTTLTAGLVHAGATYYSDEIALLEEGTLAVSPVPLSLTVKDGALGPLRLRFPELDTLTAHMREDHVRVRYLPPPPASMPSPEALERVRWIVFPRYDPTAETALLPIERPEALRRLLDESFIDRQCLDRGKVESLVQWMRDVECHELPISSLDAAVTVLRALMQPR